MGIRDFLFGPKVTPTEDPVELQRLLFAAAHAGDPKQLERLCRANAAMIKEQFPLWQKVPEEVRQDRNQSQAYVGAMIAIAELFADRLRTPELLQRLIGNEADNPIIQWQRRLEAAKAQIDGNHLDEAREALTNLLIDTRNLQGTGRDRYLPVTLGYLGQCHFHLGQAPRALEHFRQALEHCQASNDVEGILAYRSSLYETHRYLGETGDAATQLEARVELLDQLGRADEARRERKQAALVRQGEPLNRVIAIVNNVRFELDELPALTLENQRVQFFFERNRVSVQPAAVLTAEGEKLGAAGRYEEALQALRAAAELDRYDPHCRYLEGLTLLWLERYADAVEAYEATEELAPGWFNCRADLWFAQELSAGRLDRGTWLAAHHLEDGKGPPLEKLKFADKVIALRPDLPIFHLMRGKALADLGRAKDAEAAYRQGLAHATEPDVRSRLLAQLGVCPIDEAERRAFLREAVELKGNLTAAASAGLMLAKL